MLSHLVILAAVFSQLETAVIHVSALDSTARVDARYEIQSDTDSLRLTIIKIRGQEIRLTATNPDAVLNTEAAGALLLILPSQESVTQVMVQYEVWGELSRIPLFVPHEPTNPGPRNVVIRINGIDPDAKLTDGFPRLFREPDGAVWAQPENVPSFVRIPHGGSFVSVNRASDIFVVLLLVVSSVLWLLGRGRWRRVVTPNR